jgi:tetratricopeptide (TPR) repeat protein
MTAAHPPDQAASTRSTPIVDRDDDAPQPALELKARGDAAFKSKYFDLAVDCYLRAAAGGGMEPADEAAVHANASLALLKLGDASAAAREASEAVLMRPRWWKAHVRVAQACEALGSLQAAAAAYRRAMELDPSAAGEGAAPALQRLERRTTAKLCRLAFTAHAAPLFCASVSPQASRRSSTCPARSAPAPPYRSERRPQ